MVEQTISILAAVAVGGVLTLLGVALGAHFVFKTKREAHESLFQVKPMEGDATVVDDDYEQPDSLRIEVPDLDDGEINLPPSIVAQTKRFDKAQAKEVASMDEVDND